MIILASDLMMSILNDRTKNERQLITRFGPIFFYFNAFQYFAAFYTPWKRQKTSSFLMSSGGINSCRMIENIEIIGNIGAKWVKSVFVNYLHIMNSL